MRLRSRVTAAVTFRAGLTGTVPFATRHGWPPVGGLYGMNILGKREELLAATRAAPLDLSAVAPVPSRRWLWHRT